MYNILIIIFFATILLCLSAYFIYPLIIFVGGRLFGLKVHKKQIYPDISIIISAYNEEQNIERKIKNTLTLQYPKKKMEILVGSDGSKDLTVEIVKRFSNHGVALYDFPFNRGKTAVQNDLVTASQGEILVFTDAASFLEPEAIKRLVRNFADGRVGCVGGLMYFSDTRSNITTQSQGFYWRYESKLRELESKLGRLVGVDGPLYAARRDCYAPLGSNIISDLITPLLVLAQGKKVVLEPDAVVSEYPTKNTSQELSTRRRVTLRALIGLFSYPDLLNPFKHPFLACQIFFHKLLRWFVGPLIALNFLACLALSESLTFRLLLFAYMIFGGAAIAGWCVERLGITSKLLTVPYYFSLVNIAATLGIIDFIKKKQATSWLPVRD